MLEILILIANSAAVETLQLMAGFILAVALYMVLCRSRAHWHTPGQELLMILFMSAAGLMLPVSGFAIVPVIAVLMNNGYPSYVILPMLFSNFLFNMLVPLSDVSFTWHSGFRLAALAFAIGISAGIVLKGFAIKRGLAANRNVVFALSLKSSGLKAILKSISNSAGIIMPYLLIGAAANALFLDLAFMEIMEWVNTGPIGTIIPVIFRGYDITTLVFLLAMSILTMLMNLRNLAVLALIFKVKGIFFYYIHFAAWIFLLSIINFFTK